MTAAMVKIILGGVIRSAIVFCISFWATKHAIGHEVAQKLNAGDTVKLWQGQVPLSLDLIASAVSSAVLPILLPLTQGIWARMKDKYKIYVARANAYVMSAEQLKQEVKDTSPLDIIKTVATSDHA